jgi:hypothetical protein
MMDEDIEEEFRFPQDFLSEEEIKAIWEEKEKRLNEAYLDCRFD